MLAYSGTMPTVLTHALVAAVAGRISRSGRLPARFWLAAVTVSVLPDLDVIGLWAGIDYGHLLGHRGLLHSLPFAFVSGALAAASVARGRPSLPLLLCLVAIAASHGLLDALTDGGLGVAFFAPFDSTRYFWPWTPIRVSPIGLSSFATRYGLIALASEAIWVGLPCLALLLLSRSLPVQDRGRS